MTMNCLTTRSTLLATPSLHQPELSHHLTQCPSCRAFAAAVSQQESQLRHAIDVPVPEHLQERILLQTQLRQRQSGWRVRLRRWVGGLTTMHRPGMALALCAVVALSIWMTQSASDRSLNWGDVALAHVLGEPSAMTSQATVSQAALKDGLARYGLLLNGEVGIPRFLEHCAVPGGRGTHIVIETRELGKVTLLLPPAGKRVAGAMVEGEGFAVQVVDISGVNFGIVSDQSRHLPALAALLARHLTRNG